MALSLPDSISSSQDLKVLILEIKQFANWVAHTEIKNSLPNSLPAEMPKLSQESISLVKEWGDDSPLNRQNMDELVKALESIEASAPVISVTLAAAPSIGIKKSMTKWLRDHINPNLLVNFTFNSTLLGGMVLRYDSHVFDWSFRRQLLANLNKFPEVLRRV